MFAACSPAGTSCISNAGEPVETEFEVLEDGVRCTYCDTIIRENCTDHNQS